MKKVLLFLISLFLVPVVVRANSISNIEMDVYVDNNGTATITETWNAYVSEGTELYHPYFNVGKSEISMISANMDGEEFSIENYWNINSSMQQKAHKAGVYKTGDEIDLCVGITDYGSHVYQFKYQITNFILKSRDADILYWTLFPHDFSAQPSRVYIKVYSDFSYSKTLDVWGYGNLGGTAYVYDGYIEMESKGSLSRNESMVLLVKYPSGTFNEVDNVTDKDFEYYHKMAEKGATHYNKSSYDIKNLILGIISYLLIPLLIVGGSVILSSKAKDNYDFGETGNRVKKDVPNFRDIPCNKDIIRAYFIASKYNLIKKKEDFLGAIILKWLRNGNVGIEKVEEKRLFKDDIQSNIIFKSKPVDASLSECEIYDWMLDASKDGKLESKEFEKWCRRNYSKILTWFDSIINYERDILIEEGKIRVEKKGNVFNTKKYIVDPSLMIEAEQLAGLKKFLTDFTLIKEKEPIEVQLWDEYLMFAQIFGIAKQVAKQFKDLYPEIGQYMQNVNYDIDDLIFISNISHIGISSATTAQQRASSYSSGGGGFSSGGGGGGSFGGGGGGGGFR